jgi:hypothetical protein
MATEQQPYRVRYFLQAGSGKPENYTKLATVKDQASVGAALKMAQAAAEEGLRLSGPKAKPDATKTQVNYQKVSTFYKKNVNLSAADIAEKGATALWDKAVGMIPYPVIGSVLTLVKDKAVKEAKDRYHMSKMGNPQNHHVPEVTDENLGSAEYLIKENHFGEIIQKYEFVRTSLDNMRGWAQNSGASRNCRTTYNVVRSYRYIKKEHDQLVYLMDWMMSFLGCMEKELEQVHAFWDNGENKYWGEVYALSADGRQNKECFDCGKHPKKKCMRTYYKPGEMTTNPIASSRFRR